MQKRRMKRALSFMLTFCLLVGLLPCIGVGAFASASDAVTVTSEADLKKALKTRGRFFCLGTFFAM